MNTTRLFTVWTIREGEVIQVKASGTELLRRQADGSC